MYNVYRSRVDGKPIFPCHDCNANDLSLFACENVVGVKR